jgi:hypothetical protein
MLCLLVHSYRRFGGKCYVHLQRQRTARMMEAVRELRISHLQDNLTYYPQGGLVK